ncbi:inter-alpha-trypsin inhibitor heavy chain H3-like isoform X3 [Syngnathus scovelli]|uniref:inter-alpha-trypsin inhibitor heavy chain H3-like isoform X3 n=1 Tax=Syngnathus scovelli TaxID=161590 RepID=UPI002110C25C|nr:inter-alpha-trypsin inhibitor heavy chain H3-like isoform X3 [Syngnathus scovelli]
MERTALQVSIFGLLLAFGITQPKNDWDIYNFNINCTVTSRYATTIITSRVVNRKDESQEIEFHVRIPKNAFITKFRMLIDGQMYDGVVKAKEAAQQQYSDAVSRGESAGIVSSVGRTLEEFKTSVTVAPLKKVTFELTYEELLKRTLGKYELLIHARPMQPVKDFKVDVNIQENAGISFIDVKGGLSTGALADAITKTHSDQQATVNFYPTVEQQKSCESCGDEGMNGDLVIVYDVNRNRSLGDVKTSSGYFVHHFAPSELPRIPKNVVFVIDKSGSMHGKKIEQTRAALIHILNDLAEDDFFGLITFDSRVSYWKRELVQANSKHVKSAKEFARKIREQGGTNINDALLDGSRMLNENPRKGSASILILLTDGDPTSGVTNLDSINSNVMEAIQNKFPLYCLGFGFDVEFSFLEKLSLLNNGAARRIYPDADADLQLKGFYDEVATPLLTDVVMTYIGGANLTRTNFSQYYNGSEIVVAGQLTDNNIDAFVPRVLAISKNTSIIFSEKDSTTKSTDSNIQRVWAYLTVKQLLEKELQYSGDEKERMKNETLRLSLKYNFVTPLTSMVVTKPTKEKTEVLHKPSEEGPPPPESPSLVMRSPGVGSLPRLAGASPGLGGAMTKFHHGPVSGKRLHGKMSQQMTRQHVLRTPYFRGTPDFHGYLHRPDSMTDISHDLIQEVAVDLPRRTFLTGTLPTVAVDLPRRTFLSGTLPPVVEPQIRFLLSAENQSLPLCFDITASTALRLLHVPSTGLSVNGALDGKRGFRVIVVHFNPDITITVNKYGVTANDGQVEQMIPWQAGQEETVIFGSVTVIKRNLEVDITVGETRLIILHHGSAGEEFLWPVLRQRPSDDNAGGILAQKPAVYEDVSTHMLNLKIKDQEVRVSRTTAADYSFSPAVIMPCWLTPAASALQSQLSDFTVQSI